MKKYLLPASTLVSVIVLVVLLNIVPPKFVSKVLFLSDPSSDKFQTTISRMRSVTLNILKNSLSLFYTNK